jgi:hypothetical protein
MKLFGLKLELDRPEHKDYFKHPETICVNCRHHRFEATDACIYGISIPGKPPVTGKLPYKFDTNGHKCYVNFGERLLFTDQVNGLPTMTDGVDLCKTKNHGNCPDFTQI